MGPLAAIILWQQQGGAGGGLIAFLPILAIAAMFVLFLLPQQKRQKKWQQMLNELKSGDKVITTGGLRGTIISIKEDVVQLRVPPDSLRIEVSKQSVAQVARPEESAK